MKTSGKRLVISFFTGGPASVDHAASELHSLFPSAKIEVDPATNSSSNYLRMPDESMLSVWLPVADLSSAFQTLQVSHARSIFLTGGEVVETPTCGRLDDVRDCDALLKRLKEFEQSEADATAYLIQSVGLGHTASQQPNGSSTMHTWYDLDLRTVEPKSASRCGKCPHQNCANS